MALELGRAGVGVWFSWLWCRVTAAHNRGKVEVGLTWSGGGVRFQLGWG